jgi:hypothetical protein
MTDQHRRSRFPDRPPGPERFVPDSDDMPWEHSAKLEVHRALETADWSPETGEVRVCIHPNDPSGPSGTSCRSLGELEQALWELATSAWDGEVPVDGGGRVFEMDDELANEILHEDYHDKLEEMAWVRR